MKRKKENQVNIENDQTMVAYLFDLENGTRLIENIHLIRIHSQDYRLMVLSDHTPLIGELNGSLHILTDTKEIDIENIKGFYSHVKNEFHFIKSDNIKEEEVFEDDE